MRIAIVSDIHDNLTALEAVIADLRDTSPDLILHGGDLVGGGSSPAEVVGCIRDLGWQGVFGNSDEAVARPESLEDFASNSHAPPSLWNAVREMTDFTRDALGKDCIAHHDDGNQHRQHQPILRRRSPSLLLAHRQ